jgi:hypothetical protein
MEVLRRKWRARAVIRGHVWPANSRFSACRQCPRVTARAQADVPVSYPRRVVCFQNRRRTCCLRSPMVRSGHCGASKNSGSFTFGHGTRLIPAASARAQPRDAELELSAAELPDAAAALSQDGRRRRRRRQRRGPRGDSGRTCLGTHRARQAAPTAEARNPLQFARSAGIVQRGVSSQ